MDTFYPTNKSLQHVMLVIILTGVLSTTTGYAKTCGEEIIRDEDIHKIIQLVAAEKRKSDYSGLGTEGSEEIFAVSLLP